MDLTSNEFKYWWSMAEYGLTMMSMLFKTWIIIVVLKWHWPGMKINFFEHKSLSPTKMQDFWSSGLIPIVNTTQKGRKEFFFKLVFCNCKIRIWKATLTTFITFVSLFHSIMFSTFKKWGWQSSILIIIAGSGIVWGTPRVTIFVRVAKNWFWNAVFSSVFHFYQSESNFQKTIAFKIVLITLTYPLYLGSHQ